jgi:hypothetical protein
MRQRTCYICGQPTAHGIRLPGVLSSIPANKRGSLAFCTIHESEAFQRRDGPTRQPRDETAPPQPAKAAAVSQRLPESSQRGLFD